MTGRRLSITTLLLLLATIICSVSVGSVKAEAVPARMLRDQVQQDDADLHHSDTTTSFEFNGHANNTGSINDTNASTHAAIEPGHEGIDLGNEAAGPSNEAHSSGYEAYGSGHDAAGSGHETAKPDHESPSFMTFLGPAVAGVLAIVLIGCVIAFKNRKGKGV